MILPISEWKIGFRNGYYELFYSSDPHISVFLYPEEIRNVLIKNQFKQFCDIITLYGETFSSGVSRRFAETPGVDYTIFSRANRENITLYPFSLDTVQKLLTLQSL